MILSDCYYWYYTYFDENVLVNAILVRLVALSVVDARVNDDNCAKGND